jgi:hypothetical protein
MKLIRNLGLGLLGVAIAVTPMTLLAPSASAAAPMDSIVSLTQPELKDVGFPRRPNTTAWGKGTAEVDPHKASTAEPITITGTAPKFVKPGTILTMERFLPSNRKGTGTFQVLEITATVRPDRSFTMIANLGRVGRWGYRVGYETEGDSPEFVGFQFQARTTS